MAQSQALKILLLDIETAPMVVYAWGLFDQNISINQIVSKGYTLCYAAQWYGSDDVLFDSVRKSGAPKMLRSVHELLNQADAVVHYNGKSFDIPTLNAEFFAHGMLPPAPYKQVDLYRVVKAEFRVPSKKMDFMAELAGVERKVENRGMGLWRDVMNDDPQAWREMEEYNRGDIVTLRGLYERMRPWIRQHPNHGLYDEPGLPVCTNCGGGNLERRGFARTTTNKFARFQCRDCGSWCRESISELPKEDRQNIMRRDLG